MKKLLLTAILFASPLFAEGEAKKAGEDMCKSLSDLAGQIMTLRQNGMDMSELYMLREEDFHKRLVSEAYKTPRYSVPKNQKREVGNFKNEVFIECINVVHEEMQ